MKGEDGKLIIPPGFRFHPTDEELVGLLHLRINNVPLSSLNKDIFEWNLYGNETPWEIFDQIPGTTGEENERLYFFTLVTRKSRNSKNHNRAAGGGTWQIQKTTPLYNVRKSEVIGWKRLISFCLGDNKKSTGWVMHEYCLNKRPDNAQELVICSISRGDKSNIVPTPPNPSSLPPLVENDGDQLDLPNKKRARTSYETKIGAAATSYESNFNEFSLEPHQLQPQYGHQRESDSNGYMLQDDMAAEMNQTPPPVDKMEVNVCNNSNSFNYITNALPELDQYASDNGFDMDSFMKMLNDGPNYCSHSNALQCEHASDVVWDDLVDIDSLLGDLAEAE